jgi:hypothetical protein
VKVIDRLVGLVFGQEKSNTKGNKESSEENDHTDSQNSFVVVSDNDNASISTELREACANTICLANTLEGIKKL